jgi:hypothetical protein
VSARRRALFALLAFLAGAVLIVVFDALAIRMTGLAGLITAVVLGTSVIASPAVLAADGEESDGDASG